MAVVLSDFRPVHLTEPVRQEKLREIAIGFAEFVARSNAGGDGANAAEASPGMIRAAWERYCVSPKHIQSRRVAVLPDAEAAKDPCDLDYATILFSRGFLASPGGWDLDARLAMFREHACAAIEKMYPQPDDAPDEIIHVSTTGYRLPSPVHELVSNKNWIRTTVSHCYHQGCYGAFPAVRMAAGILSATSSGLARNCTRVDIAHTEICSIHVAPECLDAGHIICDSLFGDGFIRYSAYTLEAFRERPGPGLQVLRYAEGIIPDSLDAMTWGPISNRFEMKLSANVPRLIAPYTAKFIDDLLRDAGLDLESDREDIVWVIHPGGPAIVDLVGACLHLTKDQIALSKDVLREGGNMSSATVPHIWDRLLHDPGMKKGTPVLSIAFGPGLTAAAMVARVV
jgi:predicted naringenin-chalcone synthase